MAILSNGLGGIAQGQQIAQNNFALTDLNRQSLQQQLNDAQFADLVNGGASPTQALGLLGQTSPIARLALQNTGNGISLQQALAPQAIGQAQRGNFGLLNNIGGAFGGPGNQFNAGNLNSAFGLLGAGGLSVQQQILQNQQVAQQLGLGGFGQQAPAIGGFGALQQSPALNQPFGLANLNNSPGVQGVTQTNNSRAQSARRVNSF